MGSTEKKGALIGNFLESHVKKEIKRAKKLECFYCKQLGANIDCCYENCGKSFHVPCAVREHCLFEFIDKYPSFCHKHSVLQIAKTERFPNEKHSANEICCICKDEMNKYHPIESFQLTQNDWCHKLCMMQYAQASAVHFKCPLNHLDVDTFKNVAVRRGIFIPDSDAAWEMNPNYFVGLTERPKMCAAATNKDCQHPDGPVFVELSDIVKCNCCGDSLHDMCIIKVRLYEEESFYCDTCFGESYEKSIRNKMTTVLPGRHYLHEIVPFLIVNIIPGFQIFVPCSNDLLMLLVDMKISFNLAKNAGSIEKE